MSTPFAWILLVPEGRMLALPLELLRLIVLRIVLQFKMGELQPDAGHMKGVDVCRKAPVRVDNVVADFLCVRNGLIGITTGVSKIILGHAFREIRTFEYVHIAVESAGAEFFSQYLVHCVVHRGYVWRAQALQHSVNTHRIRLRRGNGWPACVGPAFSRRCAKSEAKPLLLRIPLQDVRRCDG